MSREPIFEAILRNMVLGNAVHLKKKARIKIEKAAVLIGICDETGTLKEGEVWISVNNGSFEINEAQDALKGIKDKNLKKEMLDGMKEKEIVVSGYVVVTKNPCSHPGDVRLLRAIDSLDPRFDDEEKG